MMKTVFALRKAGFIVCSAKDAIGCTEVASEQPFYVFNPRVHTTPEEIYAGLLPAKASPTGGYRVIFEGECPPENEAIPYRIVLPIDRNHIGGYLERYKEAVAEAERIRVKLEHFIIQVIGK
jgi:hypothetical protein